MSLSTSIVGRARAVNRKDYFPNSFSDLESASVLDKYLSTKTVSMRTLTRISFRSNNFIPREEPGSGVADDNDCLNGYQFIKEFSITDCQARSWKGNNAKENVQLDCLFQFTLQSRFILTAEREIWQSEETRPYLDRRQSIRRCLRFLEIIRVSEDDGAARVLELTAEFV